MIQGVEAVKILKADEKARLRKMAENKLKVHTTPMEVSPHTILSLLFEIDHLQERLEKYKMQYG